MAIEAPISKRKKNNYKIYIGVCVIAAVWFGYDGYVSTKFKATHTQDGKPDSTLVFNRWAPLFFIGGAVLFGLYLSKIQNRKMVAGETELVISDKERIPYDSVQKIDKTYFDSKGYFIITHKDSNGREANRKLSDRNYDNLRAILDHLVAKIT
jgi:hypothetical protein